jgi:4-hydroxy-tetrahydrodipicolinate synthase
MTTSHPLLGCGTALVTPFTASGALDERALTALVEAQLAAGIHFLVPCGSTGEAATLTHEEHVRVVQIVANVVNGRVPVVAGAGSNDTAKAIAMSKAVADVGATHLLHVSPMYNKPPQRGLLAHFRAIAEASALPIMLYNVPGRTGGNIEAATTLELAAHPRIVAIKEASGNLAQIDEILRLRPDGFAVLSGDDAMTLPMMALGAEGVVSVVSNVFPAAMVALFDAARAGDLARAQSIHRALLPFFTAAFIESNPMPAKRVLADAGVMQNVLRLPLVPLGDDKHVAVSAAVQQVRQSLAHLGISASLP